MSNHAPNGGKPTAARRSESIDEQTTVLVICENEDCDYENTHESDSRNRAIATATMDSATHAHETEREIVGAEELPSTRMAACGPDATDTQVEVSE